MAALTGPLHAKQLRVVVDGQDDSCLATDISVSLDGGNADTTAFCNALKSVTGGVVDGKLSATFFFDGGYQGIGAKLYAAFSHGSSLGFSISPNGFAVNGHSENFTGVLNSVNIQRQVGNIQSAQCEIQLQGDFLIGKVLNDFRATPMTSANMAGIFTDRNNLDTPYTFATAATFAGYLWYQFYNSSSAARTVTIGTNTTGAVSGQTVLATVVVPANSFAVALVSNTNKTTFPLARFINLSSSGLSGGDFINCYVALVDPALSFIS